MPIAKLDHAFCAAAQCPQGKRKIDYYSDAISGFILECRISGGKSYYLRYDQDGRQKQHKIGRWEDITFAEAKRAAQRLRSEVVLGGDPAGKRDEAKVIPTYCEFAARHLAHAKMYQRSWDSLEANMRLHITPRFGKLRMSDIRKPDVAAWLDAKTKEGLSLGTVEKLRVQLGRSFELAMEWDVPGITANPTHGIKRPPLNNKRDRFLTTEEAARLHAAVAKSRNPQLQPIVGLLLLTGARLRELLDAEWKNVDVGRRLWLIPTSKSGKPRHVPLSQAALDIIASLPRFEGCPHLVPNPETLKPFVSIKHAWQTARDEAGLPGLRQHDLRHSAASSMANAGVDLFAVGRVLGHADHKSTMRYSHLANDTLLAAVEAGAAKAGWS